MDEEPFIRVTDLTSLAEKIKPDVPYSASICNTVILQSRYENESCSFYALRDHPDSHVVIRFNQENGWILLAFHCLESETDLFQKVLQKTRVINWNSQFIMSHVPDYLMEITKKVIVKKTGKYPNLIPCVALIYELQDNQNEITCDAGLRVCRLGEAGVRRMLETYKFRDEVILEDLVDMTKIAPSAAVYPNPESEKEMVISHEDLPFGGAEEKPLAWVTTSNDGALGMLMTEEDQRRRGLAGLVMRVAGRMQLKDGFIAHAYVEVDNAASLRMFSKLKGWRRTHEVTWIVSADWNAKFQEKICQ